MGYDLTRNVHRITLYNTVSAAQQHTDARPRLYLHVDMNCFYAQVEQQSYNLFGLPIVVGGWRTEAGQARGIVATSSYEARKLGIKTGMSAFEAVQLCPYLVFMQVHYEKYQAISKQIRAALDRFSPDVEAYSMDEFFLDVSHWRKSGPDGIARRADELKAAVRKASGLVSSVGIAFSKTYAKLASDLHKPDGRVLVLDEDDARRILHPLPLKEVWGVGAKRYIKLQGQGLHTIADAVARGPGAFESLFGAYFGRMLFETVTGRDRAKVVDPADHVPKEISYMHTFSSWTDDPWQVEGEWTKAVGQLCYRMRGYARKAVKYAGYIRFQDDHWRGISFVFNTPGDTNLDDYVLPACLEAGMPLVRRYLEQGARIRGVGLHTIDLTPGRQADLFFQEDERVAGLYRAIDTLNNRYGLDTLVHASRGHDVGGKTHFFDRS